MKSVKLAAITGVLLCLPCCLLPILGTTLGSAALGSFLGKMEKLGLVLLVVAGLLFAWRYYRKRRASKTCGNQCNCKPATNTEN
ncbi:MAG: hypothetical protein BGO52_11795 [Sphingobacteriales bacterium 44-61]|nr:MAG: hypothetical protein BGO52_11795 [Sphingobacteriales bacterium 44-61]